MVASTELQIGTTGRVLSYGQIDTYGGLMLSYGPAGNITVTHRAIARWRGPGGLIPANWHQNPD